jgi:hypothetical protein
VFAPLRLFEAQREVAVVFGSAEVRKLAQAHPNDAVGQRVGEVEIVAICQGIGNGRLRLILAAATRRAPSTSNMRLPGRSAMVSMLSQLAIDGQTASVGENRGEVQLVRRRDERRPVVRLD